MRHSRTNQILMFLSKHSSTLVDVETSYVPSKAKKALLISFSLTSFMLLISYMFNGEVMAKQRTDYEGT